MSELHPTQPAHVRLGILIVEDSDMLRELFTQAFSSLHNVYAASNVTEGWQMYIDKNPDIVFMDIGLPDGNGHDLARMIKKRNPMTYVIMATASRYTDDKKEAAQNHVDGFITKPFSKKEMNDHVNWYLTNNRRIVS